MKQIIEVQEEIKMWSYHNFGNRPSYQMILGMMEELGELSHHYIKREQKIRTNEDHDEGIEDSLADLCIYLLDFCANENIDFELAFNKAWEQVKKRNWKSNSKDGMSVDERLKND